MNGINLITIFTTGLFTGGLTCIAVQGGLLTSTLANREQEKLQDKSKHGNILPVTSFLLAKLVIYTLLGFLLGWIGSALQLSIFVQAILQFAVVIFMIGTALNLLRAHPLFRYFAFAPPKFFARLIRKQSKQHDMQQMT